MAKFIVRRALSLIVTMFVVSIAVFLLTEAAPGDVARHILGRNAQPEQVMLFRRQLGLDRPLYVRYISWLIGSDWQARRLIAKPLKRAEDPRTGTLDWWIEAEDGSLKQWRMEDGELFEFELQQDGTVEKHPAGDVWETSEAGQKVFWGVDTSNRAVLWQKGVIRDSGPSITGRAQLEYTGGIRYIPLQKGFLRGDPGISVQTNRPVAEVLGRRVRNSAILAGIAFVVVMPLALIFGIIAGVNEGNVIDSILSVGGLVTTASPNFATGIFLILVFAIWLKWFPGATVFASSRAILKNPQMLALPVLTLTLLELGYVLRITRASMLEVMDTPYIRTAILKGTPYWKVIVKHALRNALLSPITVIMLHVNWLMGGVVVVEAVFGFPGLGSYLLNAANVKDIAAIEAGAMVMVVLAVGTQFIADIIYTFLNPRIRYG
jgi:peptide/nickel transport system permease protein